MARAAFCLQMLKTGAARMLNSHLEQHSPMAYSSVLTLNTGELKANRMWGGSG
jgi:hypothetical protein